MKPTATLALAVLLLTACKKEGHSVEYRVTCSGCHVNYVDGDEKWQSVSVDAQEVELVNTRDTIINGVDTIWTDTARFMAPSHWSYAFDAEHDQTARCEVRHTSYALTPSGLQLWIDGGKVQEAEATAAGTTIIVKD